MSQLNISPYVKWVGGKRQLLPHLLPLIPSEYNNYVEPFFGGGALFFALQPKKAIINDINDEITNSLSEIKSNYSSLMEALDLYQNSHDENFYYKMRKSNFINKTHKAARFIYLNKAGFNGMYRVNKNDEFNVPFGKKEKLNLYSKKNFESISKLLNKNKIKIMNKNYYDILSKVKKGDFVFVDPPYDIETNNFTSYTKYGFDREDQTRLANELIKLDKKGVKWILTNSNTSFISDLYKKFNQTIITTNRNINSNSSKRKNGAKEIIIWNYEV